MAIQVSGTQVIGNSRELTNIASVDATTAASITAAGVGGTPVKSWTNLGTLSLGNLSAGSSNWVSGYQTLGSSFQNGFVGEILWYVTASRINQSYTADSQYSYAYVGQQSGQTSTSTLIKNDVKLQYNWSAGGVRYLDNVTMFQSKKIRLVESLAGFNALPTGVAQGNASSSGMGNSLNADSSQYYGVGSDANNGNVIDISSSAGAGFVPENNASWNRRIYFSINAASLHWTSISATLYINAA